MAPLGLLASLSPIDMRDLINATQRVLEQQGSSAASSSDSAASGGGTGDGGTESVASSGDSAAAAVAAAAEGDMEEVVYITPLTQPQQQHQTRTASSSLSSSSSTSFLQACSTLARLRELNLASRKFDSWRALLEALGDYTRAYKASRAQVAALLNAMAPQIAPQPASAIQLDPRKLAAAATQAAILSRYGILAASASAAQSHLHPQQQQQQPGAGAAATSSSSSSSASASSSSSSSSAVPLVPWNSVSAGVLITDAQSGLLTAQVLRTLWDEYQQQLVRQQHAQAQIEAAAAAAAAASGAPSAAASSSSQPQQQQAAAAAAAASQPPPRTVFFASYVALVEAVKKGAATLVESLRK